MNTELKPTTFDDLVNLAMVKYPNARRIAVENFSSSYSDVNSYEFNGNLALDTRLYSWKAPTVNAIRMVVKLKQKHNINGF